MRHRKSGVNSKIKRQKPSRWCMICCWVHFTCSGLKRVNDFKKSADFFSSKCAATRKIVNPTAESLDYSKIRTSQASFGNALKNASNCCYRQDDNYLNRNETYTKFKQTKNRFPRLKVQGFRLNETWSIDLVDMQRLSRYNDGINFIFRGRQAEALCLGVTIEKKDCCRI